MNNRIEEEIHIKSLMNNKIEEEIHTNNLMTNKIEEERLTKSLMIINDHKLIKKDTNNYFFIIKFFY
jgi:hypothetical protein